MSLLINYECILMLLKRIHPLKYILESITRLYCAKNSRKSPFLLKTRFTQNAVFGQVFEVVTWYLDEFLLNWAEIWHRCSLGVWLGFVVAVFEKKFVSQIFGCFCDVTFSKKSEKSKKSRKKAKNFFFKNGQDKT